MEEKTYNSKYWQSFESENSYFGKVSIWNDEFFNNTDFNLYQSEYPKIKHNVSFHCVVRGGGCFSYNGKTEKINKGDMFFISPGSVFYYSDNEKPWEYFGISCSGKLFSEDLKKCGINKSRVFRKDDMTERIFEIISELLETKMAGKALEYKAQSVLLEILSIFAQQNVGVNTEKNKSELFSRAVDFIAEHYSENTLKIDDVAKAVNVSHSYLCRIFKMYGNVSAERYLLSARLQSAYNLILNTKQSISDICWVSGFSDPVNFSKAFKKKYGLSPVALRKNK